MEKKLKLNGSMKTEKNRDHSIVFEIASSYCIVESFVDLMANPFVLRDFCPL